MWSQPRPAPRCCCLASSSVAATDAFFGSAACARSRSRCAKLALPICHRRARTACRRGLASPHTRALPRGPNAAAPHARFHSKSMACVGVCAEAGRGRILVPVLGNANEGHCARNWAVPVCGVRTRACARVRRGGRAGGARLQICLAPDVQRLRALRLNAERIRRLGARLTPALALQPGVAQHALTQHALRGEGRGRGRRAKITVIGVRKQTQKAAFSQC